MRKTYLFACSLIFIVILAIISAPKIYISAFSTGLQTWALILLPTLFPLLFFTKLLGSLGALHSISKCMPFTQKLFGTPPISAYAFMVSILSGYPVGAKVVSDLYSQGYVSRQDAIKMCTFTSNSGPMFIYGSVGISMLFSRTLGLIMLFSHIASAVLNGMLYRTYRPKSTTSSSLSSPPRPTFSLAESMTDSILSILVIGGFVSVFFVIIEFLNQIQVFSAIASALSFAFGIDPALSTAIMGGIVEMTHGCQSLSTLPLSKEIITILSTLVITFGGIATMLQAFAFLQKIGISLKFFLLQKTTQTIIATLICTILVFIF